jgi:hypothetical protein
LPLEASRYNQKAPANIAGAFSFLKIGNGFTLFEAVRQDARRPAPVNRFLFAEVDKAQFADVK